MVPCSGRYTANITWLIDMFKSLERFATMLPVRDDIAFTLSHHTAGLCYTFGKQLDAWPAICPSGNPSPCTKSELEKRNIEETLEINSMGTSDHVDATVAWRPRDITKFPPPEGEGVGGQDSGGIAHLVGGNYFGKEMTAPIMAQEVGHLFGLEPKDSPHIDDPINGSHSKDPQLIDHFAFDFYLVRP